MGYKTEFLAVRPVSSSKALALGREGTTLCGQRIALPFLLDVGYFFLCVVYLTTVFKSCGNSEFGEDVCLQHNPPHYNQNKDPDTHAATSFLSFILFQYTAPSRPDQYSSRLHRSSSRETAV